MKKLTMREAGTYVMHEPEEWLPGKIIDIEETAEGKYGPGLKFILVLDDDEPNDDGTDAETWAYTSQVLSPKSKLYAYASAILGEDEMPEAGETFDVGVLVGKAVDVFFERYQGVNRETGAPQEKEKVTRMRASKKKASAKAARRPAPVETDDDEDDVPAPPAPRARKSRAVDEAPF